MSPSESPPPSRRSFEERAGERPPGVLAELWDFLVHNKKWWLTPVIVALIAVAALVLLGQTPLAPFIYPLF